MAKPIEQVMNVRADTDPSNLGSSVAYAVFDGKQVTLRAVGANAVNRAVKSIVIANGYVSQRGMILTIRPGFIEAEMPDHEVITGISLRIVVD